MMTIELDEARCLNLSLNNVVCEAGISQDTHKYHRQVSWIPDLGMADMSRLLLWLKVGA